MENIYARMSSSVSDILQDELLLIVHGGEMPEVAMHGSLYYLTVDLEGPRLTLSSAELACLKTAVVQGYHQIIQRDLTLENRGQGLYRGLARCAINWDRMTRFCQREGLEVAAVAAAVRDSLQRFLEGEVDDAVNRGKQSCVNCSQATLERLAAKIGLAPARLPQGWRRLF